MQFIKASGWQPAIAALSKRLQQELNKGKKVLWLVPGGSNIAASVAIMGSLPDNLTEHLAVLLTDERYGVPGHRDSNFKQLHDAGFSPKQATFTPALAEGLNLQEAVHRYEELVESALSSADVAIGQFGMGADGHIAGILPLSAAAHAHSLASGYEAPPHIRLTLTFEALDKLDAGYLFAFGDDKEAALQRLLGEELELEDQPAQILKQLPEAYIYNDQLGDPA